jgi:hypothetical protein
VSDTFWEAIQLALPASGIPAEITTTPPFTSARHPSQSVGSSPMDISSDLPSPGWLAAPVPTPQQLGDDPDAPIVLSSDSEVQVTIRTPDTGGRHVGNEANAPPPAEHEASLPLPSSSMSGERPSDHFPSTSVSYGDDAAHALELSSDSPTSSFHPSQAASVPDMGSARRGGKMTMSKPADQFEEASPAVIARARYLNVIPARDTKSMTPDRELSEVARAIPALQRLATAPLTDGTVFNVAVMEEAQREAEVLRF